MTYCIDLHFDYDPIINKEKFLVPPTNKVYMSMLNLFEVVSAKFLIEIGKTGITFSNNAELFYTQKNQNGILHRDISLTGPDGVIKEDDYVKINFMFGGDSSLMNWYTPNENSVAIKSNSHNTGSPAERFIRSEVTHVHSATINYPSLVQVGIPHDITNNTIEDRYVICLVPICNNKRMTMELALEKLKPFIK